MRPQQRAREAVVTLLMALLIVTVAACSAGQSVPARSQPHPSLTTTLSGATATVETTDSSPTVVAASAEQRRLAMTLYRFARQPSPDAFAKLPLEPRVALGLGARVESERRAAHLAETSAWRLDVDLFRAHTGPFSALDVLRKSGGAVAVTVGPHRHCAAPPVPAPAELTELTVLSLQPVEADSCLDWWSVDLFVTASGTVRAVVLDIWEP